MSLELRPELKPDLKMVLTPEFQQAIKILQFSSIELQEVAEIEKRDNPALEEEGEQTDSTIEAESQDSATKAATHADEYTSDPWLSPEWGKYIGDERSGPALFDPSNDDNLSWENTLTRQPSLQEHLISQLRLSRLSADEKLIGSYIVGNLDDNGYLALPLDDICSTTESSIDQVEAVLKQIQFFDPVGIAARDLQECLLVQLESRQMADSLAARVVSSCLTHLRSKRYEKIAGELGATVAQVADAMRVIVSLEPKPARDYQQDGIRFVRPDVFIDKAGDNYVIRLNEALVPRLQINRLYQRLAKQRDVVEKEVCQYLRERVERAKWFIEAIEHRQRTLRAVVESIFKLQRPFLDHGRSHLRPMMMREIAADVRCHESTVSRATANKWVDTPHGIFELGWFFQGAFTAGGGDIASEGLRVKIRHLIGAEDREHPYTDEQIVKALRGDCIRIARRTIAKYRDDMRIPPASKRRQPDFRA